MVRRGNRSLPSAAGVRMGAKAPARRAPGIFPPFVGHGCSTTHPGPLAAGDAHGQGGHERQRGPPLGDLLASARERGYVHASRLPACSAYRVDPEGAAP